MSNTVCNLLAFARMMFLRSLLLRSRMESSRQLSLVLHVGRHSRKLTWNPNNCLYRFRFFPHQWEERWKSWKSEFWRIDFSWLKSFCKSVDLLTFWAPTGRGTFLRRSHVMLYIVVRSCRGNNSFQRKINAITFLGTTHPKFCLTHSTTNMEPRTSFWWVYHWLLYTNGQTFNLLALARMMPLRSLVLRCQKQLWRQSSLVLHLIAVEKYSLWEPNMEPHRFYFNRCLFRFIDGKNTGRVGNLNFEGWFFLV